MKINPVRRKSALDCAIDAIRSYILDNRLQPGDVLPPETELARELEISRNILREAMRHYRTLGIIDSKPRLGAVIVRLAPENPYAGYQPFLAAGENSLCELFEMRHSLETGAAPFLVRAVTPESIAALGEILEQMRRERRDEDFTELDMRFHTELLHIMRNRILDGLLPFVIGFFNELRKEKIVRGWKRKPRREILEEHRAILAALERRDAAGLAAEIARHNEVYFKILKIGG